MLRSLLLIFCVSLASGCAAKKNAIATMPVPEPGTREALLPQFQPSGSACLDAIIVNFLNVGCETVASIERLEYPGLLLGCLSPQPGAMDMFSNSTFVYSPDPMIDDPLLNEATPICADMNGVYAMLPLNIRNFGGYE